MQLMNDSKLIEKIARNIIQKIYKILKDDTWIQIDILLPIIKGEELFNFFLKYKRLFFSFIE